MSGHSPPVWDKAIGQEQEQETRGKEERKGEPKHPELLPCAQPFPLTGPSTEAQRDSSPGQLPNCSGPTALKCGASIQMGLTLVKPTKMWLKFGTESAEKTGNGKTICI